MISLHDLIDGSDQLKPSLLLDTYLALWIVTVNGVNEYRY